MPSVAALLEVHGEVRCVTVRKKIGRQAGGGGGGGGGAAAVDSCNKSWALVTFETTAGFNAALKKPTIAPSPQPGQQPLTLRVEATIATDSHDLERGGASEQIYVQHAQATVGSSADAESAPGGMPMLTPRTTTKIDANAAVEQAVRIVRRASLGGQPAGENDGGGGVGPPKQHRLDPPLQKLKHSAGATRSGAMDPSMSA